MYHYRAYATNTAGTSYGDQVSFHTLKDDQAITFGALSPKAYGDTPFDLTATASSGLSVTYASSDTGVARISGSTLTITGAGTTTITASQAGNSAYNPCADVQRGLVINKAELTVTAEDKTRLYQEDNPLFTLKYSGWCLTEGVDDLSTLPTASTQASMMSAPGDYDIVPSGGTADNYTFSYVNGSLTITEILQKPQAILANKPSGLTRVMDYNVNVGGICVLYYRYKVDEGAWSDETSVANPIDF